jgi:hypothetical protein
MFCPILGITGSVLKLREQESVREYERADHSNIVCHGMPEQDRERDRKREKEREVNR